MTKITSLTKQLRESIYRKLNIRIYLKVMNVMIRNQHKFKNLELIKIVTEII